MTISKMETVAVLGGYFHFGKNHVLIFLSVGVVRNFRTTDSFQNGNSRAAIAKFATTEIIRDFRFFYNTIA